MVMGRNPFNVCRSDDGKHQVHVRCLLVQEFVTRPEAEALCDALNRDCGSIEHRRRVRHAFSSAESFPGSEYTPEECEFLIAIDRWKRRTGTVFPTWIQILDLLRGLGWHKG